MNHDAEILPEQGPSTISQIKPQTMKFAGMETSIPFVKLPTAMAKFQATVKQPKKDADNPFFGSKYVPLENVVEVINAVAPKLGISYFQWAVQNEKGQIGIATRVSLEEEFIIFDPVYFTGGKGTVQDGGSVQTYLRRYALNAAFGLASENDDDGNSGRLDDAPPAGKSPAQVAYEKKQADKNKSTYQKGDYQKQAQTSPPKKDDKPAPPPPEMASDAQITKIKSIVDVIANTQNIHPDDVYTKFQKLYEQKGKPAIPPLDNTKMTKKWASGVIGMLNKHNEAGQLTAPIKKEEPKKEEPKPPTKEQQEQIDNANYDAEGHGDR